MRIIGSFQAKTHFSKLLADVSKGEKIMISKNGKVVAMLVPADQSEQLTAEEAYSRLLKLRKKLCNRGITADEIQDMKKEGRR